MERAGEGPGRWVVRDGGVPNAVWEMSCFF